MNLLPQEMGVLPLEMAEMREENAGMRREIDLLRQEIAILPLEMTGMAREMAGMRRENGLLLRGKELPPFWNRADPLPLNHRANAFAALVSLRAMELVASTSISFVLFKPGRNGNPFLDVFEV